MAKWIQRDHGKVGARCWQYNLTTSRGETVYLFVYDRNAICWEWWASYDSPARRESSHGQLFCWRPEKTRKAAQAAALRFGEALIAALEVE